MAAVAGHGTTVGVELDPSGSQGTFTDIGQLTDITWPEFTRESTEVTPHGDTIATKLFSAILSVGSADITVNYEHDDTAHDDETGLFKAILDGELRGFQFRGPGGGASDREIIASAEVTSMQWETPTGSDPWAMSATIEPTGKIIVDGVEYGTVS